MLNLTRNVGEKIVLSNAETGERIADIVVTEISTTRRQVALGIHAPLSVRISRDKLNGNQTQGVDHGNTAQK